MKLAFCLFKYFPFGGLQRDFLRIAQECMARGHQVDVYTMLWEGERAPGINLYLIPVKGWQNHVRAKNFVNYIAPKLKGYDAVIGFNKMPGLDIYYAADTCYQAKARASRGMWYRLTRRYRHLINYEKAVFQSSKTEILSLSGKQHDEFMHFYQTPLEKFHLLPPGIAKDRIAPANADSIRKKIRDELGLNEKDYFLLMVGSGFKTKGLDRIILGYAALPEEVKARAKVYVVGKDNPHFFQQLATRLNIRDRIQFLGGRHDVPHFFLAADLLLHPAYNENTGTVLLEALASGLPVLTTDVCGYANHILEAQAGKVILSPFDQLEFNKAISDILLSQERSQWKQNAIDYAKRVDIYSLPQRAADHIERIIARK